MPHRSNYATPLDAIGLYLIFRKAADVLINEIEGGYLLGFMVGAEQRVVTLSASELAALEAEAGKHKEKAWDRKSAEQPSLRVRLRYLGRYLETRAASCVVIQERALAFAVEYSGVPVGDLHGLERLYELIDDERLRKLPT